jgi:hypothetical protein
MLHPDACPEDRPDPAVLAAFSASLQVGLTAQKLWLPRSQHVAPKVIASKVSFDRRCGWSEPKARPRRPRRLRRLPAGGLREWQKGGGGCEGGGAGGPPEDPDPLSHRRPWRLRRRAIDHSLSLPPPPPHVSQAMARGAGPGLPQHAAGADKGDDVIARAGEDPPAASDGGGPPPAGPAGGGRETGETGERGGGGEGVALFHRAQFESLVLDVQVALREPPPSLPPPPLPCSSSRCPGRSLALACVEKGWGEEGKCA